MRRPTDELRDAAADVWSAQRLHPFVTGLADGTLADEKFNYYLRQDYQFLLSYTSFLRAGAAKSPDPVTTSRLAELAHTASHEELGFLRELAADRGISAAALLDEQASLVAQGYADFLLRTAHTGDFLEFAAAMLPCVWGYTDLGQYLLSRPEGVADRYRDWVESYVDDALIEQATWCRELVDRLVENAGGAIPATARKAFLISSRYELAFWDMAWREERWPGTSP